MSNILLLADKNYGDRLKSDLESIGYTVSYPPWNPSHGDTPDPSSVQVEPPDLIVVDDESFPDRLPETVLNLRRTSRARNTPVLLVADEERAPNLDFSTGISDFIIQPYSLGQLEARLRLALWRAVRRDDEHTIKVDDLIIDLARFEVRVGGELIELTLKEYDLLKYLVANSGRVFTRSDLLDRIWGYDYHGGMRTIDVHVARLRTKLAGIGAAISTVRGVGYGFDWPVPST